MQFRWAGLLLLPLVTLMMPAAARAQTIDGGYNHTIVALPNGTVLTWGENSDGQLGMGDLVDRWTPTLVPGLSNIIAVAAGGRHSLALESNGTVWAWGHGFQVGDGTGLLRMSPVAASISGVTAIAAGEVHSLALDGSGNVWVWGTNSSGQFGNGGWTGTPQLTPVIASNFGSAIAISGGLSHTLVVRTDTTVWGSGNNINGQLGDGTTLNTRLMPVQMTGVTGAVEVAAGMSHSLVRIGVNGAVWGVGANGYGQLCSNTGNRSLAAATPLLGMASLAAGRTHSIARTALGVLVLCGENTQGQIGNGTTSTGVYSAYTSSVSSVSAVGGGAAYSAVLDGNGNVWTWGSNSDYQLGDGTNTTRTSPVLVY